MKSDAIATYGIPYVPCNFPNAQFANSTSGTAAKSGLSMRAPSVRPRNKLRVCAWNL